MFRFGVLYLCRGREARGFFESGVSIFNTPIQRIRPGKRRITSPTQEPTETCNCAFHSMVVVVTRIYLKHRVDPLALIEGLDLLCVLPDTPQNRIPGLALLVSQGEVHAVRPTLWLIGEDIVLHSGKPERARHTAHPRK